MAKRFQKTLISTIILAIIFVSYGLPVQSIASESKKLFSFKFFHKEEISLNAYFEEDVKNVEKILNVNDTARLTVEINPLIQGYFEEGSLELNLKNGNKNNFKIKSVTTFEQEQEKTEFFNSLLKTDTTEEKIVEEADTNSVNEINSEKIEKVENEVSTNLGNGLFDTTKNIFLNSSIISENKEEVSNSTSNEVVNDENSNIEGNEIDELKDSENMDVLGIETEELYEIKQNGENQIQLKNIIENTKIFIDLEYKQSEEISVEDLYSSVMITLTGNYIDEDLESIEIFQEREIKIGWEYTKEIEASSNYTKVSPFTVGENFGTIIENVVTVKREVEEKALPIKETNIKVEIPKINDKLPIAINVVTNKLFATLGKELTGREFTKNNWYFDKETGILEIKVVNAENLLGSGEDVFNIICRYEDYIEEEIVTLNSNVLVAVEEFSSNSNIKQEKLITKEQDVNVTVGELISYYASSTNEKINKGKINANFYATQKYESDFSNIINLNVLTSDVLEQILIQPGSDLYQDKNGNVLDATEDIKYKGIKFKLSEIKEMLENGSTIDLLDENNNVFHTISKDNDSCSIVFLYKINTFKVRINNVQIDGNITIEFIKSIENNMYTQQEFNEIEKVLSRTRASVKYVSFDEEISLPEIETEKEFLESNTVANISMDREYLSTVAENENVEFKIELNNNLETSDFYKNPSFEVVFPNYIKEVKLNNIYTLFPNGLTIKEYNVFNENGINKIKIDFEGTQTEFNTSNMTNGTNIIINVNLVVDELTPRKQDEIKLYYCNEAVSNYQTQTNWSIAKEIPEGILRATNGYDSTVFEYLAPTGLITINSISNYDGTGETIKSIKQGEKITNIPIQVASQIATMELVVMNNTGNECDQTVLLGRIPFKGNKDIESQLDLGTNVDALMKSELIADSQNTRMSTIYYSTNPDADRDLNKEENRWKRDYINLEEIKSFLIVVDGTILPGEVLRYRYDFEIPEKLGFDARIQGSFGAFYNNKKHNFVMFESSVADKVGLVTEVGPKLDASLSVDIGDGAEIPESKRLKYTVTVRNIGSIVANDLVVKVQKPNNTNIVIKDKASSGDYGFVLDPKNNNKEFDIKIGSLNPGESNSVSYYAKAGYVPELAEYADGKDENGYFIYKKGTEKVIENTVDESDKQEELENSDDTTKSDNTNKVLTAEKEYITEVPDTYIIGKATVTSSLLTEPIETNEVKNKLVDSNFESDIRVDYDRYIKAKSETNFTFIFRNISGKDMDNVIAELNVGDIYNYQSGEIDGEEGTILFDEESGKITFYIGNMKDNQEVTLTAKMIANQIEIGKKEVDCYVDVFVEGLEDYRSTIIPQTIVKAILEAKDISVLIPETMNEDEEITISTQIDNIGSLECTEGIFEATVSENLKVENIVTSDGTYLSTGNGTGNISAKLPVIGEGESLTVDMILKSKNTSGQDAKVCHVTRKVKNIDQEDIVLDDVQITILNTEKTEEELEDERIDKLEKEHEEQKRQEEDEDRKEQNEKEKENEKIQNNDNLNKNENNDSTNNSNNGNKENNGNNSSNKNNNNLNNNTNINIDNNKEQSNKENQTNSKKKYTITGNAWLDKNKNGIKDNEDKAMKDIKVYLLTLDNRMLKSTSTNSSGMYQFSQIDAGKYIVAAQFDEDKYVVTTYKKAGVPENQNSDVIKSQYEDFSALTNEIIVENKNIVNIDIGLQDKDIFDLTVKKYLSKVKVTTNKRNETYEFDNLETAKVEIKAKEIKGAKVDLEYTIVLENVGNVKGCAEQLVDFIDKDIIFDGEKNKDWAKGNDGYVYAKNINKIVLDQGEKKEFKLNVTKNMTEENVGTVSNKVSILKSYNSDNYKENTENNTAIQNTVILISTGYATQIITVIISIILITILVYITNNKRRIKNGGFNPNINMKKVYK